MIASSVNSYFSRVALLVFLLIFTPRTFAQNPDSLLRVIKEHAFDDTTRVQLLLKLVDIYQDANLDTMVIYANEALSLANTIHYNYGRSESMSRLGLAFLRKSDYEKSLMYYKGANEVYKQVNNKSRQANTYLSMADVYLSMGNRADAFENYSLGATVFERLKNATGKGFALLGIGGIYDDLANYPACINYYLKALESFEQADYTPGISLSLSGIATIYAQMNDFENARNYVNRCLQINLGTSTTEQRLNIINNIGIVYGTMKQYNKALGCFTRAVSLADSIGDDLWKNHLFTNIADMYLGLEEYDSAFARYSVALQAGHKLNDSKLIIDAGNGLGNIYVKRGEYKTGIDYFLKSFELAKKIQATQSLYETAGALSAAFEKVNDFAGALTYHHIYTNYGDSIYNAKNDKKLQQLQFDYDMAAKDSKIQLLEKNKIIARDEAYNQKLIVVGLLSGIVLLGIVIGLLYRTWMKEKLARKNMQVQKIAIEEQAVKLRELNWFKDKTFSVLSHDLRGPVYAFASTMAMLEENQITHEEFELLRPEVTDQLASLSILMENLLNWARNYLQGKTNAIPQSVDLDNLVRNALSPLKGMAAKKQISIDTQISAGTIAYCDPSLVDIIVRNLVMNAIKFTRPSGSILIAAKKSVSLVELSISDTGIGMNPEKLSKLFTPVPGATYGTGGEKGTGLGLLLCAEFIKANDGTITVTSQPDKGTTFTITLPAWKQNQ